MKSVSVVICTYNRKRVLLETLETLAQSLRGQGGDVEVLVVDNASTDGTDAAVASFIREHPGPSVSLLREDRQGLSWARNAGMARARGDVICFLDDDVFVPAGWLGGILSAFELDPRTGCVAGRVLLHWPDMPRPKWLNDRYVGTLSELDFGGRSRVLVPGDSLVGANFALSREAALAAGLFNTELGRKRAVLLSGEETDYADKLWKRGFVIVYSAAGYVHHRVLPEQLTYSWFSRRFFWNGVTTYFRRKQWHYPLSCVPRLLTSLLLMAGGAVRADSARVALSSFRMADAAGAFYAWYLQATGKQKF